MLEEAYPRLHVSAMADVTYALCITGTSRPESLPGLLKDSPGREGYALGLYYLANEKASYWDWKTARPLLMHASLLATKPELTKRISEDLDRMAKPGGPASTQPGSLAGITLIDDEEVQANAVQKGSRMPPVLWLIILAGLWCLVIVIESRRRADAHQLERTGRQQ